jgi:predicted enzyme related to lactoylglutathione lyase
MGVQAAILIEEILMPKSPIVYLELPSNDVAACKQFYHSLFGWSFQDFGPDYAAFSGSGLDGGLNGASPAEGRTKFPLAVIDTGDLEAMEKSVVAAGGRITLPIFSFPGGRRFHFTDPSGNELAVMQKE